MCSCLQDNVNALLYMQNDVTKRSESILLFIEVVFKVTSDNSPSIIDRIPKLNLQRYGVECVPQGMDHPEL